MRLGEGVLTFERDLGSYPQNSPQILLQVSRLVAVRALCGKGGSTHPTCVENELIGPASTRAANFPEYLSANEKTGDSSN
jgi:hypothetical protein